MLLLGAPVIEVMQQETEAFLQKHNLLGKKMSIFLMSDDIPSRIYVNMKCNYAKKLGLEAELIEQPERTVQQLLDAIDKRNTDPSCIGMIVQLPLAPHLKSSQAEILAAIDSKKDLDGLNGIEFGKTLLGIQEFLPATPKAVMQILDYYGYGSIKGKNVLLIGQSNLIGKPLAAACMMRGATVHSFNGSSDQDWLREVFVHADIVVSATGVIHLIDETFMTDSAVMSQKVLIDVGRGKKDGKAAGDIDRQALQGSVAAITPVPGGVGPVTVASLFHNIIALYPL